MRKMLVVAIVVVVGLAGCGSSGGNTGTGSASGIAPEDGGQGPVGLSGPVFMHGTKTAPSSGKVEVEQDDFYFNPTYIKAEPGQKLTIELKNEGQATHSFTIDSLGVDTVVAGGKTATVTLTVPTDGAVRFYCKFHEGKGMQGAIFTAKGQPVTGASPSTTTTTSGGSAGIPGY